MKYVRSRPWGTRGPWFSDRAGSRRRGHYEASPLVPGDEFVHDAWANTASDWERDAPGVERPLGSDLLTSALVAPGPVASFYPGRIDESGLRELARRAQNLVPEQNPPSQTALEAISTILRRREETTPPGRKSA